MITATATATRIVLTTQRGRAAHAMPESTDEFVHGLAVYRRRALWRWCAQRHTWTYVGCR